MARRPASIEIPPKLRSIFNMLTSPNEGERESAANAWAAACKREGIDPLDLRVTIGGAGAVGDRITRLLELIERNQAVIDQLAADSHKLAAENQALKAKLATPPGEGAEVKKLRLSLRRLEAKLAAQQDKDERHAAIVAGLETQLADAQKQIETMLPDRDLWHDRVVAYLAEHPDRHHTTAALMASVIGKAEPDVLAYRRLGAIMRAIGGWTASNNVPDRDTRVRGYIKVSPHARG